jgi:hypothetical protein
MHRTVIMMIVVLALTALAGLSGVPPADLAAQESTPAAATANIIAGAPPEKCGPEQIILPWEVDQWPPGSRAGVVRPIASSSPVASPERVLYPVVITLPPGKCIPYESLGNRKNGAIVMIVQAGSIEFTAQAHTDAPSAEVRFGGQDDEDFGAVVPFGTSETLNPGQWVSQNGQVWFTYRNPGTVDAVIVKAVWAVPIPGAGLPACPPEATPIPEATPGTSCAQEAGAHGGGK